MQHYLVQHVKLKWSAHLGDHFSLQVALSGGVDSVVLLHILSQLRHCLNFELTAIHINHGISSNADYWTEFCQKYCDSLSINLTIATHTISRLGGESLENNARKIRYQEFAKSQSSLITLAHHQNDQIETTLSQIFRGSDLHNIAGMKELSQRYDKYFWRPLLDVSRKSIEEYAKEFNLLYITDESNIDTSYLRNFIRHDILPKLIEFDQHIVDKALKLPKQVSALLNFADEVALDDLNHCLDHPTTRILTKTLASLSIQRQMNVIALFIKQQNLPLPSTRQITEFIRQALNCDWDKSPQLKIGLNNQITKVKQFIFIN